MLEMWRNNFHLKTIPRHKMHSKYQHPCIQLYAVDLMFMEQTQNQMTPGSDAVADKGQGSLGIHGVKAETTGSSDDNGSKNVVDESHQQALTKLKEGDLSEWEWLDGCTATSGHTDSINYPFSSLPSIILVLSFHLRYEILVPSN